MVKFPITFSRAAWQVSVTPSTTCGTDLLSKRSTFAWINVLSKSRSPPSLIEKEGAVMFPPCISKRAGPFNANPLCKRREQALHRKRQFCIIPYLLTILFTPSDFNWREEGRSRMPLFMRTLSFVPGVPEGCQHSSQFQFPKLEFPFLPTHVFVAHATKGRTHAKNRKAIATLMSQWDKYGVK